MRRCWRLPTAALVAAAWLAACSDSVDGPIPVSRIADGGFARHPRTLGTWLNREISLWGYLDPGNLYGDDAARRILGDLWSGSGPGPGLWRFDLKARAGEPVGRGLGVHVRTDADTADLLVRLAADARAGRSTRVLVTGRLRTFDAPTQGVRLTGLTLLVDSSRDIRLGAPTN